MYRIYGIKNCDTMKKAFNWLDLHQITYQFHNYKTDKLSPELLQSLIDLVGWEAMLNTKGITWRKLDETRRATINNETAAKELMLENPSIIKRPLLVSENGQFLLGFSEPSYQEFTDKEK